MNEARLRWQCRRGMRELDVLLTHNIVTELTKLRKRNGKRRVPIVIVITANEIETAANSRLVPNWEPEWLSQLRGRGIDILRFRFVDEVLFGWRARRYLRRRT